MQSYSCDTCGAPATLVVADMSVDGSGSWAVYSPTGTGRSGCDEHTVESIISKHEQP